MCDRLVGRIDLVDAEVSSMLDKWRSVEEGGKSLQDASQKLLDERVCCHIHLSHAQGMNLWPCVAFTGPTGSIAGSYRHDFGILPGARTRDASAQPPWRVTRPPNGFSLYGRARRRLYRVPQVPRMVNVFSCLALSVSLP